MHIESNEDGRNVGRHRLVTSAQQAPPDFGKAQSLVGDGQ